MGPASIYPPDRDIYSVSRLNREVRELLEGKFPLLWVEGEVSGFSRPTSGHWYFTLKDATATVRCAMFRNRNRFVGFIPHDGMRVLLRIQVGLYESRGEFQLVGEHLELSGVGALLRAFEELKRRLAAEGLFDNARKRSVPSLPQCIGVVTSPTSAAIRDVLTVLHRRFSAIPVIIYPVPVQGTDAPPRIAAALALAGARQECDVLLLTRGGGSLEDLQAFNTEVVARAIAACPIPVVSAVGHEIDITIADYVADYRAPTPSAGAEHLSPDQGVWRRGFNQYLQRLITLARGRIARQRLALNHLERRLQPPGRRLQQAAQRLDDLEGRLHRAVRSSLQHHVTRLRSLIARLIQHTPTHRIQRLQGRREQLALRLQGAVLRRMEVYHQRFGTAVATLHAVGPLATLARGYAIVTDLPTGTILHHATETNPGDMVEARLASGRLHLRVIEVLPK
ncbi:Exodeoxyribonuclease 7 large subunit [Gammaproteobacteria bacterium]